jgi:hypothetical protein
MSHTQDQVSELEGGVMTGMIGYARPLRAIGQALETLNLQSFELEPIGEDFYVRGTLTRPDADLSYDVVTQDKLSAVWGKIPGFDYPERERHSRNGAAVVAPIELHYTIRDVDRLEQEGQARRVDPHRMPDTVSLSQVLRCVGAYLNQKRARLLRLWRDAESVSVEYETSLGNKLKETLAVAELYDLWVRMYMQRAEREGQ